MNKKGVVGAFRGKPIRSRDGLVSLTDLWKAHREPSTVRTDKWVKEPEVQGRLQEIVGQTDVGHEVDKTGCIVQVDSVLQVYRGGSRNYQGTYANQAISLLYASALSDDCYEWLSNIFAPSVVKQKSGDVIKASKEAIKVGTFKMPVFQLPDGHYELSQTDVTELVGKMERSFREFLNTNSPEALPYKGFESAKIRDPDSPGRPANGVPIVLAAAYWTKESISGNEVASRLLGAAAVESIEWRADEAFGVKRTGEERNQRFDNVFRSVIASHPSTFALYQGNGAVQISVYGDTKGQIKKNYPKGIIKRVSCKADLKKEMISLSSSCETKFWKLTRSPELGYRFGELTRHKYPDAITGKIPVKSHSGNEEAVIVFQFFDEIVDYQDVEECALKRQYVRVAKEAVGVDYAFLFLVSPLGATSKAHAFIQERLTKDCAGYVGVLTVKDLARFYAGQISAEKVTPLGKRNAIKDYKNLFDYEIRTDPLNPLVSKDYKQLNLDINLSA